MAFSRILITSTAVLFAGAVMSFKSLPKIHELAQYTQNLLTSQYNRSPEQAKLKKAEIIVTDNGFLRYRKYLVNGKQEYYSFNISRFRDLDYLGTTSAGMIKLKTISQDVIVQTYNDPRGNIDSMSSTLIIPLRETPPEILQKVQENLLQIRKELQGTRNSL